MNTRFEARQLNQYLLTRRIHPEVFSDHSTLTDAVRDCSSLLGSYADVAAPFMVAIHILNNPALLNSADASLDGGQLLRACRGALNLLPCDHISGEAITVFSDLICQQKGASDLDSHIGVIANVYIHAESLTAADRKVVQQSCAQAFADLREDGLVSDALERVVDRRLSRETCQGLVRDLGFNPGNLQALKRLGGHDAAPQR